MTKNNLKTGGAQDELPPRVPTDAKFSAVELRNAVPAHCFERSTLRSLLYVFMDLALASLAYYFSTYLPSFEENAMVASVGWPIYWVCQGAFMTGLWVCAHECGHRAFSDSDAWNDGVGLAIHTALLVPYHAWRITHGRHHANTNHMDGDEVFVPKREHETPIDIGDSFFVRTTIGRAMSAFVTLTVGWPAYLICNAAGRKYESFACHYLPSAPMFSNKQRADIILSDVALLVFSAMLGVWAYQTSVAHVLALYGVPYLITNFWLVLITLLQHSDAAVPHYDADAWSWVKGALCTVDRDYGLGNFLFHHIGDAHVAHHLFHTIPHYHVQEATEALRRHLGPYYRFDSTPIASALFDCVKRCVYVKEDANSKGVLWYQSADDAYKRFQQKNH
jgi:omega-6 fatty acid desaturase / acyl-lipid omega-6 desaturase (Delta-12 desaturase)